jgi:hypothetical protein
MRLPIVLRALVSRSHVRYTLFAWDTPKTFLAVLGALWVPLAVVNFFWHATAQKLQGLGWPLVAVAAVATLAARRPVVRTRHRVAGRDVEVAVVVDDLFNTDGACVISTTTTFDTDPSFVSENSLQGQLTSRYYDSDVERLDADIERSLADRFARVAEPETLCGRRRGKNRRYRVGTVALVRPKGKTFYLLAAMHMNESGNCETVTLDQIRSAIAELWHYVTRRGEHGWLAMGILGTGHGRINATRAEVAREILKSFVAACSASTFCTRFTLLISPSDFQRHQIDLHELAAYLRYLCRYTPWEGRTKTGAGTGVA